MQIGGIFSGEVSPILILTGTLESHEIFNLPSGLTLSEKTHADVDSALLLHDRDERALCARGIITAYRLEAISAGHK